MAVHQFLSTTGLLVFWQVYTAPDLPYGGPWGVYAVGPQQPTRHMHDLNRSNRWNALPLSIRALKSVDSFKNRLKTPIKSKLNKEAY